MEAVSTVLLVSLLSAVAGFLLAGLASRLIASTLPRLGSLPSLTARSTTAALTGLLCAAFVLRFGLHPILPALVLFAVLALQLARIDISLHLLPNPLVLILGAGALALLILPAALGNGWGDLLRGALGALIAFFFYFILALITPGAMGMGDVKLAAPLGLYLGYLGWPQLFYGVLLGLALNGAVTLVTVAVKRGIKPKEVAHGPSMLAAAAGVMLLF